MRRLITLVVLCLPLFLFSVATAQTPAPAEQPAQTTGGVAKPLIKCSTCGAEFTTLREVQEHLKAHPEHKLVAIGEVAKPLVKCSTCGVEFTTLKEVQEHLKVHPEHKLVPVK